MTPLRKTATWLLLVFVIFTCGFAVGKEVGVHDALESVRAAGTTPQAATGLPAKRIVAWYFHSTKRCKTCNTIEGYAKEALDTRFKDALERGAITWKTANMDDAWNADAVLRYGLMRSSLVLVDMRGDDENDYVVLKRVWNLTGDKQAFAAYVASAVDMIFAEWAEDDDEDEDQAADDDESED